jgi:hypothetical protein
MQQQRPPGVVGLNGSCRIWIVLALEFKLEYVSYLTFSMPFEVKITGLLIFLRTEQLNYSVDMSAQHTRIRLIVRSLLQKRRARLARGWGGKYCHWLIFPFHSHFVNIKRLIE